ncbi:MAG: hypothetical protein HY774_09095 [Acidobacteria bacterium]|nr:hypothetical protein [Acidobacteriota bacterium]
MPFNRKLYPSNWEHISHSIRFVRAGGQCEWIDDDGKRCAAQHGELHPVTGSKVVLTTAHVNHTPSDNRDENLRAWCQFHHLRHDARHHAGNARLTRRVKKDKRRPLLMISAGSQL